MYPTSSIDMQESRDPKIYGLGFFQILQSRRARATMSMHVRWRQQDGRGAQGVGREVQHNGGAIRSFSCSIFPGELAAQCANNDWPAAGTHPSLLLIYFTQSWSARKPTQTCDRTLAAVPSWSTHQFHHSRSWNIRKHQRTVEIELADRVGHLPVTSVLSIRKDGKADPPWWWPQSLCRR
jgi:hypothetical protein